MFTKWAQAPNEKNVIFAQGAKLLQLPMVRNGVDTHSVVPQCISCDCPWWKMLTFAKFANVVIRLGATYKMAYCREKCKEIWNVCMNELYLI